MYVYGETERERHDESERSREFSVIITGNYGGLSRPRDSLRILIRVYIDTYILIDVNVIPMYKLRKKNFNNLHHHLFLLSQTLCFNIDAHFSKLHISARDKLLLLFSLVKRALRASAILPSITSDAPELEAALSFFLYNAHKGVGARSSNERNI